MTTMRRTFREERNRPTVSGGFTLVELLVVVAIVALLVSILTPSLQRARELTRWTICGSDLRQITHGFGSYAAGHGGKLPRGQAYGDPLTLSTPDINHFLEARSGHRAFDWRPMAERYGFYSATAHIMTGAPAWNDSGNTSSQLLRTPRCYFGRDVDEINEQRRRFFSPNSMGQGTGRQVMWTDLLRLTPQGEFYGVHGTGGTMLDGAASGESSWRFLFDLEPSGIHVGFYDGSVSWADMSELDVMLRGAGGYSHYYYPNP